MYDLRNQDMNPNHQNEINDFNTKKLISEKCDFIKALLLDKNKKYGDSALRPIRIISKCTPMEALFVRIEDKLSRLSSTGMSEDGEDQVIDIIGYFILISIGKDIGLD